MIALLLALMTALSPSPTADCGSGAPVIYEDMSYRLETAPGYTCITQDGETMTAVTIWAEHYDWTTDGRTFAVQTLTYTHHQPFPEDIASSWHTIRTPARLPAGRTMQ